VTATATRSADAGTRRARRTSWEPTAAQIALAGALVVWIVTFAVLAYRRQDRFWSVDFDMGLHDQSVWLLAHGRGFLTVRGLDVFGHHATLGYFFFVPFYWLGAGAQFLNLTQVVWLALGAIPVFLLARYRLGSEWAATALATAYLLHPALQFFTAELFHPEVMAVTPLLCAYYCSVRLQTKSRGTGLPARDERPSRASWGWFAFWCVVAVSWKEDVALAVVVLGLIVALRGERKRGLLTAGLALAWFSLWTLVLFPAINGGAVQSEGLYTGVGGSASGIARTLFEDPGRITSRLFGADTGGYLWHLFAPFGLVAAWSPVVALGLPQLVLNLLSDVPWTRTITFHYAALPVTALAAATVEGVAFLWRRRPRAWVRTVLCGYVVACALVTTVAWGPSPIGAEYRSGVWAPTSDPRLAAKRAAIAKVPDGVPVSATYTLVPQLSHRAEIYSFPNPWEARNWGVRNSSPRNPSRVQWIVMDRTVLGEPDRVLFEQILKSGKFRVVYDNAGMVVARRVHR
jgi:uncharacterized membrane protein